MKKYMEKTGHRFKSTAYQQFSTTVLSELKPEEFADYVRRAEKLVLPTLKEKRLSPAAAQLAQLLAGVFFVSATVDEFKARGAFRERTRWRNAQTHLLTLPCFPLFLRLLPSLLDCPRSASVLMWAISHRFAYILCFHPNSTAFLSIATDMQEAFLCFL